MGWEGVRDKDHEEQFRSDQRKKKQMKIKGTQRVLQKRE